jgi:small GTP-binding protein
MNAINDSSFELLPEDYSQYDLSFKVIVIGDSNVGKSCITVKATKNTFESNYNTTVGFEFCSFNIKLDDKVIKLQIWDTCGQEIYRSLVINFYRSCACAVIVFSIDK